MKSPKTSRPGTVPQPVSEGGSPAASGPNSADINPTDPNPIAKSAQELTVPSVSSTRLSEELERLLATFEHRSVTLREVFEVLHGRGYDMILILLAFPFCTPIPLPGVSTVFGIPVAFIGLRLALGQKPWLPRRVLDHQLPQKFFPKLLGAARRLVRFLEWFLKPRLCWAIRWAPVRHAIGGMILVSGLLLMLPFPIPFSNFIPATTVLFLACSQLEEDGVAALFGGFFFLLTLAYFTALGWGGSEVIHLLHARFVESAAEILPTELIPDDLFP